MKLYKNFNDLSKDLNNCKDNIYKDEDYHWWTGVIDGCCMCGIINSDERYTLIQKLEDIISCERIDEG